MPKIFSFLIFSALILLIDLYAWQAFKILIDGSTPQLRRDVTFAYWVVPLIALGMIVTGYIQSPTYWPAWLRIYGIAAIVILYICKFVILPFLAIDDIVRLVRWVRASFSKPQSTISAANAVTRY